MNEHEKLKIHVDEIAELINLLRQDDGFFSRLAAAIDCVEKCLKNGNKILVAGNGGSAADAQHFAGEFVGRYKIERKGYPVIALTSNTAIITAWSNDYDFHTLFARKIESFGKPEDLFIALSTSGKSKNLIDGVAKAKELNLKTMALLGSGGGHLKDMADLEIIVPSHNVPRIQEVHKFILHTIAEEVEKLLSV